MITVLTTGEVSDLSDCFEDVKAVEVGIDAPPFGLKVGPAIVLFLSLSSVTRGLPTSL